MLEYITLSINITMPFILLALLGLFMKRRGMISDTFVAQGNKVIFYFAIPVTIFNNIHSADLSNVFDLPFLIFNSVWLIVFFLATWWFAVIFIKDKEIVPSFVNSAYRSSLSVVAPPLFMLMFIDPGASDILSKGILTVSVLLILSYVTASILFAVHNPSSQKGNLLDILTSIAKNPIIIGVVIGLAFNVLGWTLPVFSSNTVNSLGGLAMPLAMICVGGNLTFHGFDIRFKYVLISAFIKLFIMPISSVIVALLFGFTGSDLTIIMILNALPMAVGAYVMQAELGGDSYIGASVLMLTMTLSALTLTFYIFLFRIMGFLA